MKTSFTFKTLRYSALMFVFIYLAMNLNGQTSHIVTVSGISFTPKNLTITAGDTVIWKNTGGSHNVDGQQSVFPSNPASFGNDVGSGWIYKFVFTLAGTYDYHCDPHASLGMTGSVIVNPKSATSSQVLANTSDHIVLYPNPSSQYVRLSIPIGYASVNSIKIYSVTGSLIDNKVLTGTLESVQFNISNFKNGIYFMEISAGQNKEVLKFIKQ